MAVLTKHRCLALFAFGYVIITMKLAIWHQGCTSMDEIGQPSEKKPYDDEISVRDPSNPEGIAKPPNGQQEITVDTYDHQTFLKSTFVPNTIHYVWCGKRWFEFVHYMSMKSVIREIRPDLIYFHYNFKPVVDEWIYNTWFREIRKEYPFIRMRQSYPEEKMCLDHARPNNEFIYSQLTRRGGIYVHEITWFLRFPIGYRNYTFIKAKDAETNYGFLLAQRGYPGNKSLAEILDGKHLKTRYSRCQSHRSIETLKPGKYVKSPICISVEEKTLFPKDIWKRDDEFGRIARRIFYESPEIPEAKPSYDVLVPNIAHIVWIGGGTMDFLFYLSVLSLLHIVKVEALYIHGDAPPTGPYWNRVKDHPRLHHIFRETPHDVFGTRVQVLSHVTDVWRVDLMIRYGGIYVDTDTAFVRPLDRDIRAYDAVAAYDWTYWNHPFPDTINFGVTIGKKNATYWRMFQRTMRWWIDKDWSWNGLRRPYKVLERHPDLIRIDPRMQMTCFECKCHPTWHPDYHKEDVHHLNTNSIKDWRKDIYAFHWTLPTPFELLNETTLYHSNTMFAEIGKFILKEAGVNITNYASKTKITVPPGRC